MAGGFFPLGGENSRDPIDPRDGESWGFGDSYPGQAILGGGSAREVLHRLIDGDPMELRPRCVAKLRDGAWFVSLDRTHLRAAARTAYASRVYRGHPPLDVWLHARIDQSIEELVREEQEDERVQKVPGTPLDPLYAYIAAALGLEAPLARRACVALNRLPVETRATFFAVVLDRKSIHRRVAEGNGPPAAVHAALKTAMDAIEAATGWDRRTRPGDPYDEF